MRIVICSKSAWWPRIRREHAVAESAAADGHEVVFVEKALDARALLSSRSRRAWSRRGSIAAGSRIRVVRQSTLIPGHWSDAAEHVDTARLRSTLRRIAGIERSVVVATQPWQWPAVAAAPAARRVFDCADDWQLLIPRRAGAIAASCRRIADEADAVIVASAGLASAFPGCEPTVIANGASQALLDVPAAPRPSERRMIYAGTLSERFDAPFLSAALERLANWSVELYGECQYAHRGSAPDHELEALLDAFPCVSWHGPVERRDLAPVLDRGRVLIAPHRGPVTRGQDSMKLYDYAARERPIVCTPGALGPADHVAAAGVVEAATPAEFAIAVVGGPEVAVAPRAWVATRSWNAQWPAWASAAFGGGE